MGTDLQWLDAGLVGVVGLLIGSFLNVVIYRTPKMMEHKWEVECAEMSGQTPPQRESLNLLLPRSRCPHCGHLIAWHENLPVISYALLRGRCSACKQAIGLRYPLIEISTGCLFFFCAWHWGITFTTLAWCVFSAALLSLAMIDWDTTLLPDDITLPLLWLGLAASALNWIPVPLHASLWGAIAAYLSLWSIYWLFKLLTGKEGMGYGDFKLFAALGAWFGWPMLVPLMLMASVVGAVVGIGMKWTVGLREGGYVPFGPFLAGAGFITLLLGPATLRNWLNL
jgi:leader peptidase (prepilin peptidase) / N-methyltransferase